VALTFYATLALGAQAISREQRVISLVVLLCGLLPYAALLWWLTLRPRAPPSSKQAQELESTLAGPADDADDDDDFIKGPHWHEFMGALYAAKQPEPLAAPPPEPASALPNQAQRASTLINHEQEQSVYDAGPHWQAFTGPLITGPPSLAPVTPAAAATVTVPAVVAVPASTRRRGAAATVPAPVTASTGAGAAAVQAPGPVAEATEVSQEGGAYGGDGGSSELHVNAARSPSSASQHLTTSQTNGTNSSQPRNLSARSRAQQLLPPLLQQQGSKVVFGESSIPVATSLPIEQLWASRHDELNQESLKGSMKGADMAGGGKGKKSRWAECCCAPGTMLPSQAAIERFGFIFEDIKAEGPGGTQRWVHLAAIPLNFSQKAACIAVVGSYALVERSWVQLAFVLVLQLGLLAYLVVASPYTSWELQWMEVACHTLEAVMFILACTAGTFVMAMPTTWMMIGLQVGVTVILLVYDLYSLALVVAYFIKHKLETRRKSLMTVNQQTGQSEGGEQQQQTQSGQQ